jgi:hypothetical protein
MRAHRVSRRVSDVRNDDPGCIAPLVEDAQSQLL